MRILTVAIVIGPLMLVGALPAAAQSRLPPAVQSAAAGGSTVDRDTYAREARDEVREWAQKLRDFSQKAEDEGKLADNAIESDLHKAWTRTDAASRKLQTAGKDGWEGAKTSYERASRKLADAWDKVRPQQK